MRTMPTAALGGLGHQLRAAPGHVVPGVLAHHAGAREDHGEGVVQLVREVRQHRLHLGADALAQLALELVRCRRRLQGEDRADALAAIHDRRRGEAHRDTSAGDDGDRVALAPGGVTLERAEAARAAAIGRDGLERLVQRAPADRLDRVAEQCRRRGVHERDPLADVHGEDCLGKRGEHQSLGAGAPAKQAAKERPFHRRRLSGNSCTADVAVAAGTTRRR
jgi:hypothetical protein